MNLTLDDLSFSNHKGKRLAALDRGIELLSVGELAGVVGDNSLSLGWVSGAYIRSLLSSRQTRQKKGSGGATSLRTVSWLGNLDVNTHDLVGRPAEGRT
jgi:hypothetical protein